MSISSIPRMVILSLTCEKCKKKFNVATVRSVNLPYTTDAKCPHCKHVQKNATWYDVETRRLLERKKLGLGESVSDAKFQVIQKQIETLQAQIKLLNEKFDSLEKDDLQTIREDAKERSEEIVGIQQRLLDLEDRKKFQEEQK